MADQKRAETTVSAQGGFAAMLEIGTGGQLQRVGPHAVSVHAPKDGGVIQNICAPVSVPAAEQ